MKCAYHKKCEAVRAGEIREPTHPVTKQSRFSKFWSWLNYNFSLWSSVITCLFVGALISPYFLTNVIPMVVAYILMYLIYFGAVILILFVFLLVNLPYNIKFIPKEYSIIATAFLASAWVLLTFPILLSTTSNYSQYLYYGEEYFQTMKDEYDSRSTETYFKLLQNSPVFRVHTALPFV
jgi:hypothetical protein